MIEITNEQINRVNLILGSIKDAPNKAFYNVINRGLSSVKSNSGKEIRNTYRINQSVLSSNQKMKIKHSSSQSLEGSILFAGNVIPLIKFDVSPKSPERKKVSAGVLKEGGKKRIEKAYVANLGRYGDGVFERATKERNSSQELYGPSVAHMMNNEDVLEKIETQAQKIINERIEHEITRILNGYGG